MRSRDSGLLKTAALCLLLWLAPAPASTRQALDLGAPRPVAAGIALYHLTDQRLLDPASPISIWLLQDRSGARRHPRRAGQRRDRRHRNRRRDRGPSSGGRRGQRRLLPAAVRRSGRRLQDQRPTGERHEAAARRGRDRSRRRDDAAGVRPGHRHDDAPPAAARAGRHPHGDRGRGHDPSSRQADALHPRLSRPHRHRSRRPRVGRARQSPARGRRAAGRREDADSPRWLRAVLRRIDGAATLERAHARDQGRARDHLCLARRAERRVGESGRDRGRRGPADSRWPDRAPTGDPSSSPRRSSKRGTHVP